MLPELERLIVDEPYRERFRAQYVLALYRAGRQKDALEAYRRAREVFVEELGVDPSPELQDLERRILRHDPSLKAPELPDQARVELPTPPTPLLGRRLEVAAVTALLRRDDVRLVTLTGPGGTGKTRLALAAAEELGPELRDGAVFVDLAAVRDPQLLAAAIAHTLGVAESSSSLDEAVGEFLREKRLLLVLDNLEQLLPDVELVAQLLAAAPRLLVLGTSRSPLRLAGEHAYPVPPLPLPATARDASFEELAANEAVALFVARARAADPAFELNDENARAVADVCGRLDGLPLAIELAAARAKLLHPSSIGGRLDQALELLTGGARDLPARQRTLRSTLEWSYDLLGEDDRMVFARLSVFSGGWTLAAAEAVCSLGELPVLESLTSLVDGNLVRRLERPGPSHDLRCSKRFGSTRRSPCCGRVRPKREAAARRAHAGDRRRGERCHSRRQQRRRVLHATRRGAGQPPCRRRVAVESDALELEIRLLVAMRWFWVVRGHLLEGRRFFDDAITRIAGADISLRATAPAHGATFRFRQGENALAKERWEEAIVSSGSSTTPTASALHRRARCGCDRGGRPRSSRRALQVRVAAAPRAGDEGPARSAPRISGRSRTCDGNPTSRQAIRGGTPPATTRAGRRRRRDLAPQPGTVADRSRSSRRGTRNARGERDDRRRIGYREVRPTAPAAWPSSRWRTTY